MSPAMKAGFWHSSSWIPGTASSARYVHGLQKPRARGSISYLKAPSPVAVSSPLTTSPADILRELGAATTFVSRSRLLPVAQLWAHVRYCATMRARGGMLALTPDAAQAVVHHHKVAQSEQLGIGLALVVARAVLRQLHPRLDYHVVDADVALRAGPAAPPTTAGLALIIAADSALLVGSHLRCHPLAD
jgi:hypothetical protein